LHLSRKIIIPVGLPASGKTSLRDEYIREHPGTCVVSPDDIRMRMLDYENTGACFDESIEKNVWNEALAIFDGCMKNGKDIYFDATNMNRWSRDKIIRRVDRSRYKIIAYYIDIDPYLAIVRNEKRKRKVPSRRILEMASVLEMPSKKEGIDTIIIIEEIPSDTEKIEIKAVRERYSIYNEKNASRRMV